MNDVDALNLGLFVFRIVVAIVFLAHGIRHIFGGGKIAGTGRWFESLGMRPGIVHAWVASVAEVAAGVLLILGLLTPLAGAAVTGTMAVAWITNHLKNGFFIFAPGEGYEYVMTLTFAGLLLATVGAGEWSLDEAIFDPWTDIAGVTGLVIWLVAGVGGAALLLATAWRPNKTTS
jgi:putative oxidoreductase